MHHFSVAGDCEREELQQRSDVHGAASLARSTAGSTARGECEPRLVGGEALGLRRSGYEEAKADREVQGLYC